MVVLHEYSYHKIYYIYIIIYIFTLLKVKYICVKTDLEETNFYSYVFYRLYVCYRL